MESTYKVKIILHPDDVDGHTVEVRAEDVQTGISYSEYMGECRYDDPEDFKLNSGYYNDMADEAVHNLGIKLRVLYGMLYKRFSTEG